MTHKKRVFLIVFFALVGVFAASAITFGFYEIFFDKAEAAMFKCDYNKCAGGYEGDCSDPGASIHCHCSGGTFNVCMVGRAEQ